MGTMTAWVWVVLILLLFFPIWVPREPIRLRLDVVLVGVGIFLCALVLYLS